jgi:phosphatidylglycerophosphate synthase
MASAEVQLAPVGWAAAGAAGVAAISAVDQLPAVGWFAALAYVIVSNALLLHGLRRRGAGRFGWANVVTATRSALVACITGLVAASFVEPISVPLMVGLAIPALALDAVDGWVARGTGSTTELGARFDMEVDAFLLLVLSLYVAPILGPWVLTIGLMRYVFVAAGWGLPWLRVELPPRYWRKVVTAAQGIALTFAASGLFPQLAGVLVAVALALLVESFGRDVAWLALRGRARRAELGAS